MANYFLLNRNLYVSEIFLNYEQKTWKYVKPLIELSMYHNDDKLSSDGFFASVYVYMFGCMCEYACTCIYAILKVKVTQ